MTIRKQTVSSKRVVSFCSCQYTPNTSPFGCLNMSEERWDGWKSLEPAPKKFQKLVIQTLVQKDKEASSLDEEENFELPQFIGTKLELTKKGIKALSSQLLKFAQYVEYMYLDGNKLTELPETFFQSLRHLKWLDLRNNELIFLPTAGLKTHPVLEFLLLQGNRIRHLPTELGFVTKLKGLQIAGNPIENVPYAVIAEGFHSVTAYLRKMNSQENILLPNSDGITVRPSTVKDDNKPIETPDDLESTKINGNKSLGSTMPKTTDDHDDESYVPINTTKGTRKLLMRSKMCPKPKQRIIASSYHTLGKRHSRLGYKRKMVTPEMVEERVRKDMEMAKRKETLEKQARKIQRMKDKEVLKTWRRQTERNAEQLKLLDNYQHYPSRNFISDTPFDVDPEFLNMLNRIDLYRSLKEVEALQKRRRRGLPKLTISDLERQMKEITRKLESLSTSNEDSLSPRTKQTHLCNKIAQMKDIQKTLHNLQYKNVSISGGPPALLNGRN